MIILKGLSKIYEGYWLNSMSGFVVRILSNFIGAHRKSYSSNVLTRLFENWKKIFLIGLLKSLHCIPHKLLVTKLHVYGFSKITLVFVDPYSKWRKQGVKINDKESFFPMILSSVS